MVSGSINLGGTASDIKVGKVAHGLMMMTWVPTPVPDEVCFESIKAGVDALPPGTKAFLNSGEFYAYDNGTGNLEMLNRFFTKYPEYADKTFLSVKGGVNWKEHGPDGSMDFLRKSVDTILKALGPHKKLDLFQPARIDTRVSLETLIGNLATLKNEGKFDHIGLSECKASTLRAAHAIHPITAAEIEVSPWAYEQNQKDVIATAEELNITVVAYSPIGRGFLTGQFQKPSDLPEGDIRRHLTRFKDEEIMKHNFAIVEEIKAFADKKKVTPAQLSIAWVAALGPTVLPLPGSSKATRTLENLQAGDIVLTAEEKKALDEIVAKHEIKGDRYYGAGDDAAHLWR